MKNQNEEIKEESTPENDRTRSLRPQPFLGIILPLALLGGALWLGTRQSEPITNSSSVLPTTPRRAAPKRLAQNGEASKVATLEIFVPNDDATLDRKSIEVKNLILTPENIARNRVALQEKLATQAIGKLLKDSADFFPKGSALVAPVSLDGDIVKVNLNRAYAANAESWSSAETTTRVMSIINTALATKGQIADSEDRNAEDGAVQILIEGKKIDALGPLDTADPLAAERVAVQTS